MRNKEHIAAANDFCQINDLWLAGEYPGQKLMQVFSFRGVRNGKYIQIECYEWSRADLLRK